MAPRWFMLGVALVYGAIGILGFFPALVWPFDEALAWRTGPIWITSDYGLLLGLLPVNVVHNLVYCAIAVLSLGAAFSERSARCFARALAVVVGLMMLGGLIAQTSRLFGLMPLHSYNVPLHLCTTVLAAYFGWVQGLRDEDAVTYGWVNGEEPVA